MWSDFAGAWTFEINLGLFVLQKFSVAVAEYMHMCLQDRGKAAHTIYLFLRSFLPLGEMKTRF